MNGATDVRKSTIGSDAEKMKNTVGLETRKERAKQSMAPLNPPHNFTWHQSMLRISDPEKSLDFYKKHFNMILLDKYDFPSMEFSLYFLATLPDGEEYKLEPGTEEAHQYLWTFKGTTLELTHNYKPSDIHPGNEGEDNHGDHPDGFGHIAFMVDDVYRASEELESNGVAFRKRPNEGRMKGLAFALDPDGYWIEIIRRKEGSQVKGYTLAQTMLRIKDPKKSVPFYEDLFGMTLISERHFPEAKFSLFFLGTLTEEEKAKLPSDPLSPETFDFMKSMQNPVLELTHNHGTEDREGMSYHNGNQEPRKGFGHIGFLCDDVYKACDMLHEKNVPFIKEPNGGKMKGLAFVQDPDGYWIEVIQRGLKVELQE